MTAPFVSKTCLFCSAVRSPYGATGRQKCAPFFRLFLLSGDDRSPEVDWYVLVLQAYKSIPSFVRHYCLLLLCFPFWENISSALTDDAVLDCFVANYSSGGVTSCYASSVLVAPGRIRYFFIFRSGSSAATILDLR